MAVKKTLAGFLNPTPPTEEIRRKISDRFKDPETGEVLEFVAKPMLQAKNAELQKKNTKRQPGKNGMPSEDKLDAQNYQIDVVIETIVQPDFRSTDLCEAFGVIDPRTLVGKMFTPGEFTKLVSLCMEANNFRDSEKAAVEEQEAKNS